ncbi:WD40 repeat domain-containing protein [Candidatus Poribacteria bacterium]|nr:WD40 repeat domain-containing protein [Candidatus Poribacteria bacterium]
MKTTKFVSYLFLITLAVLSLNVYAQDLPNGAISQINISDGPVNAIAYSRSADQLAIAAGKNIHIYDASTYKELMLLNGHTDSILALVYSPNGKLLVSGGLDKTVRLWETETGKLRCTREEHTAPVRTVAFSLNGKRFWSGSSKDNTIRSWYPRDGGKWSSKSSTRTDVALITIASTYKGETVAKVYKSMPIQCQIKIGGNHWNVVSGHTDSINVLALYEGGKIFATGSVDKTIQLWHIADRDNPLCTLIGHTNAINAVDFSINGKVIASGSSDKTVRLWDVTTGQHLHTFTGHTGGVGAVTFLGDKALTGTAFAKDKALASGCSDGTLIIWDIDKVISTK